MKDIATTLAFIFFPVNSFAIKYRMNPKKGITKYVGNAIYLDKYSGIKGFLLTSIKDLIKVIILDITTRLEYNNTKSPITLKFLCENFILKILRIK